MLFLTLFPGNSEPAFAAKTQPQDKDELQLELDSVNLQIEYLDLKVKDNRKRVRNLEKKIKSKKSQIQKLKDQVLSLADSKNLIKSEIESLQNQINEGTKEIKQTIARYRSRLVQLHRIKQGTLLGSVFSAKDLNSFLNRYQMVKYLLKNDKELIKSLNTQNSKLKKDRADLNKKNQLLQLNQQQFDKQSKKLNTESKSLNAMLSTLVLEKKLFLKKQKDLKASKDKLELEFQKIEGQRIANPGKLEAEISKDAPALETKPVTPTQPAKVARLPESASKAAKVMNFNWPIDRKDRKSFTQLGKAGSYALNIFVKSESEVKSAGRGKILYKGNIGGLGNVIIVGHERGFSTVYAKIDDIWVGLGQIVEKNTTIGRIYGTKDSPLHFEIRFGGKKQPPLNFLPSIK